jgi:hypothetical protein
MELAHQKGMSLRRCQREISSREFVLWKAWREYQLHNEFNKDHYYLAQIAAEIRRANERVKNPNKIKDDHFMLKFTSGKSDTPRTKAGKQLKVAKSKAFWFAAAGIDKSKAKG